MSPPRGAVTVPGRRQLGRRLATDEHHLLVRTRHAYAGHRPVHPDPAGNGDTFVGAPGAILDGQGDNHYAFTGSANNVTIEYLTIQDFGVGSSATTPSGDNGGQGVVNHDSGRGWVMKYLTVQYNAGAGVFVGTDGTLSYSCLRDNGEYGFQGRARDSGQFGATHLTIDHNEVTGNNTWNWESKNGGCGCSGADKFWNVADVSLTDNYIHDNHGPGIWADTDNANFDVEGNYVSNNDSEAVIYETSYNLRLVHNTFVRNALVDGPALGGFPDPAVYISESGGDSRVPHSYGAAIDISGNTFTNNWGGVVLWENADRYCSSGANTSTGVCTLVDPSVATISNCSNSSLIGTKPYYDDCRWKTQNVLVRDNDFIFDPAKIGRDCTQRSTADSTASSASGAPGSRTRAPWSKTTSPSARTTTSCRTLIKARGRFMAGQQGSVVSWETWQGRPYDQDAGSTLTRNRMRGGDNDIECGVHLMDEQTVQRFWQDHACGDAQVGGLHERFHGDYEKFFTDYDRFRYENERHLADMHRCPERGRQAGARDRIGRGV